MLKNYIKISVRNLLKHKSFSVINILGLAVGLACCLLITLFVLDEVSYDRYHKNGDRIYRVTKTNLGKEGDLRWAVTASAYAPSLLNEFPEIEAAVRFYRRKPLVRVDDNYFNEDRFFFADSSVFEVFSFDLLRGDPESALSRPFTVVLTEETARKYFGDEDPIGRTIAYERDYEFTVTGVVQDPPSNSHFGFDFLASFVSLKEVLAYLLEDQALYDWIAGMHHTYVLLDEHTQPDDLEARFSSYIKKYQGEAGTQPRLSLQPVWDIHLHSKLNGEIEANSDLRYVYIFSAIAVLILFISCFNFMNLSLARSTSRAKEVGVRKVVGAERGHLMKQFLGEAVLYGQVALLIAYVLALGVLPYFNQLANKQLTLDKLTAWPGATLAILLTVIIGLVSASYPALLLSRLNPRAILNSSVRPSSKGATLRKTLIVTQFAISVGMMISTAVVYKQLLFVNRKNLGFDKELVLVVPLPPEVRPRYETLKQEMLDHSNVLSASVSSVVPGERPMSQTSRPQGFSEDETLLLPAAIIDDDYLETFGIEVSQGRNLSQLIKTDSMDALLVNETAVAQFGWNDPIGSEIINLVYDPPRRGRVVGVVKDFHFRSLQQPIQPLMMRIEPFWYSKLAIRIAPHDIPATLEFLESTWRNVVPQRPFQFSFLDKKFSHQYQSVERLGRILSSFSFLAILIACLGLLGLSSYLIVSRTREVGIRKVLGATASGLVALLAKEFLQLVGIGVLFAAPIAWLAMREWLTTFAYRTSLDVGVFLAVGGLAALLAFAAVFFQTIKTAVANPVDTMRYEP
jgi:putative ABC transport system permease protein